ncbi:MAG: hypothetical protein U0169_18760 [Polyangiaceae bacterium]
MVAAPNARREVERVADTIWRLLREDAGRAEADRGGRAPLAWSDFAVVLGSANEAATYRAHVAAVFADKHGIPTSSWDGHLEGMANVPSLVAMLLGLPGSTYRRADVLPVLLHPNLRLPGGDAATTVDRAGWADLTSRLGIVRGVDRHAFDGTYVTTDALSWDQGLHRLALGAFLHDRDGGRPVAIGEGDDVYYPEDSSNEERRAFFAVSRALLADATELASAKLTPREWSARLSRFVATYVHAEDDDDTRELLACVRAFDVLRDLDLDGRSIGFALARELAAPALGASPFGRGRGGVVVSSFVPMRALPFRHVFVVGLGEGLFPATTAPSPMDLRAVARVRGDVSPRDRDRYMFLETLLLARESLTLSWVARDETTGEAKKPSSVVTELCDVLGAGYLGGASAETLVDAVPLRAHDEPALVPVAGVPVPLATTSARRERAVRQIRERLERQAGPGAPLPDGRALLDALPEDARRVVSDLLLVPSPPPRAEVDADVRTEIRLPFEVLPAFLDSPEDAYVRQVLGVDAFRPDDPTAVGWEPFEGRRSVNRALRTVVARVASSSGSIERAYDDVARELAATSRAPVGAFARVERRKNLELLASWREAFAAAGGRFEDLVRVRLGRSSDEAETDVVLPPHRFDVELGGRAGTVRRVTVSLRGSLEPVFPDGTAVTFRATAKPPAKGALDAQVLPGFWTHVILALLGRPFPRPSIAVASSGGVRRYDLVPPGRAEAESYLRDVATDLLGAVHDYHFPFGAAAKAHRGGGTFEGLVPAIDASREVPRHFSAKVVRSWESPSPDDAEARAIADRRLAFVFRSVTPSKEAPR